MAGYLRDLAHRCTSLARRCSDLAVAQELEGLGVELMEKAHELESGCSSKAPGDQRGSMQQSSSVASIFKSIPSRAVAI